MKILVGIPSQDLVLTDFMLSTIRMIETSRAFYPDISVSSEKGCYIDLIRNNIVKKAIEIKADYLLFLDSDMIFPDNTLVDLIAEQKPVIGCNYSKRRPPYTPTALGMDGKIIMPGRSEVELVIAVPTGVMLIDMKVIAAMKYPWFECCWSPDGKLYGEDTRFCAKAHKAGHPVYCHHDLSKEVYHIGSFSYGIEYSNEVKQKEMKNGKSA